VCAGSTRYEGGEKARTGRVKAMQAINAHPAHGAVTSLLAANGLPWTDLSEGHLEHFFCTGSTDSPTGVVGLEMRGEHALLRSLAVHTAVRSTGLGASLVEHAEAYARANGVRAIYLLTTTAEEFFARRGYARLEREHAPPFIRSTREFADICPSNSAFMVKHLTFQASS
jgi:amino-acid N-acetyltransferase